MIQCVPFLYADHTEMLEIPGYHCTVMGTSLLQSRDNICLSHFGSTDTEVALQESQVAWLYNGEICVTRQVSVSDTKLLRVYCTHHAGRAEDLQALSSVPNFPPCEETAHLWSQDWGLLQSRQSLLPHFCDMDPCMVYGWNVPVMGQTVMPFKLVH